MLPRVRLRLRLLTLPPLALAATILGCAGGNKFVAPPPPQVTVAKPVERSVVDSVEFTGQTRAVKTVDLRARVSGYLRKIEFDDGQAVTAGQELFQIEQAPYQAAVDAADAALRKSIAMRQLGEVDFKRTLELLARQAVTEAERDARKAQLDSAAADVAASEAALEQARLNLGYTTIKSPIDGRIDRHLVDVGSLVQAEQTPMANVESLDPIYAYFNISESQYLWFMELLRENKIADPREHPPEIRLGLANEDNFPHVGHLDFLALGVDPETGTALRRGEFPNKDRSLVPGLFVRIRAEVGEARPRLLVEERAIAADQRGDYVLTVNDKNVVEYRPVKLGMSMDGLRVIEKGVDENDWVVINGLQRARPGAPVAPQQSQMKDSAEAAAAAAAEGQPKPAEPTPTPPSNAASAPAAPSPSGNSPATSK